MIIELNKDTTGAVMLEFSPAPDSEGIDLRISLLGSLDAVDDIEVACNLALATIKRLRADEEPALDEFIKTMVREIHIQEGLF